MDTDVVLRNCAFCGQRGRRGMAFAGGFGVLICRDCVERFYSMYNDPEDLQQATRPPWERMNDTELLASLPAIAATADQVDGFLVEWVQLCRSRKLSWAAIGQALGTSRQSAWERFARRVEAVAGEQRGSSSA